MNVARAVGSLLLIITSSNACALICLSQQHRGEVQAFAGTIKPGEIVTVELGYDLRGDQNDLSITWDGQRDVDGPRPRFFLTEAACQQFVPPSGNAPAVFSGVCHTIGSRGGFKNATGEIVMSGLGVVGGPHQGPANATRKTYKLHIVGDASRATSYRVVITYFRGPDC